jgi:hypothetical protein
MCGKRQPLTVFSGGLTPVRLIKHEYSYQEHGASPYL